MARSTQPIHARLDRELADLVRAEQDIADGERRITAQGLRIDGCRRRGHPTALAEALLATFRATLAEWVRHRAEILRTIGRLRSDR